MLDRSMVLRCLAFPFSRSAVYLDVRVLDNDAATYPQHANLGIKVHTVDRDAERKSYPLTLY